MAVHYVREAKWKAWNEVAMHRGVEVIEGHVG
jgi:hypothetical protein